MIMCSYSSIFDNQSNTLPLSVSPWKDEAEITINVLPNIDDVKVSKIVLSESVFYSIKCLIDLASGQHLRVHHSFQMIEPSYCISINSSVTCPSEQFLK